MEDKNTNNVGRYIVVIICYIMIIALVVLLVVNLKKNSSNSNNANNTSVKEETVQPNVDTTTQNKESINKESTYFNPIDSINDAKDTVDDINKKQEKANQEYKDEMNMLNQYR
ncbi:MAG: hypothetical protein Q4E75_04320 [bacterium]|nr:hypothetical protein [bacterium]